MTSNRVMALAAWLLSLVGFSLLCAAKDFQNVWMYGAGALLNIASIPFTLTIVWRADKWTDE